jgi:hypothetical protein
VSDIAPAADDDEADTELDCWAGLAELAEVAGPDGAFDASAPAGEAAGSATDEVAGARVRRMAIRTRPTTDRLVHVRVRRRRARRVADMVER